MKNWTELENSSFFDANARERALGMVDKGTFTEFLNPLDRYCARICRYLGLLWNLMTYCLRRWFAGQASCFCSINGREIYWRRYWRGQWR